MTGQDGLETPAALAGADALAARIIARAAPVRLGVARSAAELREVFRLRHRVVIEHGWAAPEDFPDGLEHDAYDPEAVQIVAWDGRLLVGTTRLILPAAGRLLPTEEAFNLKVGPAGRVADVGRTCRAPAYRDSRHRVLWGLLSQTWIEMRARGFTETCGIFTTAVMRVYQGMGFRVEVLGAARPYWGEERHPVLIRPAESVDAFRWKECSSTSPP